MIPQPLHKKLHHHLPYRRLLMLIFKEVGIDLSRERDMTPPSPYDTYTTISLTWMRLEQLDDGSWVGNDETTVVGKDEDEEIRYMEGGEIPQRDSAEHMDRGEDQSPLATEFPPDLSELTFTTADFGFTEVPPTMEDMDSLRARIDEIMERHDQHFMTLEDRMDHIKQTQ